MKIINFILLLLISCQTVYSAETIQGPSSSRSSYVLPKQKGIQITAILSGGDEINGYRLAGMPDGQGAYDNNNQTFTLLVNHELYPHWGKKRRHGRSGAFVSKWIITKPGHPKGDFKVLSGEDFIHTAYLWDASQYKYVREEEPRLIRLCSATLTDKTTLYDPKTRSGTKTPLFLHGEESDSQYHLPFGRAFATVVKGPNTGVTYELPRMGNMAFENVVPNPPPHQNTLVALLDDATGNTIERLGEVYFYIGTKKDSRGNIIDRAGLNNGFLYGLAVDNVAVEDVKHGLPKYLNRQSSFQLALLGDFSYDDGQRLYDKTLPNNKHGITKFLRPEDGHWDPSNPHIFYFVTTGARFDSDGDGKRESKGPGRLWQLKFHDVRHPRLGGKITCLLDGSEGVRKPDNITVDQKGLVYIQEDLGDSKDLPRIWRFNPKTKDLIDLAIVDAKRFRKKGKDFITYDVETSGIIDMEHILGPGWFLATVQSGVMLSKEKDPFDYPESVEKELVQDAQLIAIYIPPEL